MAQTASRMNHIFGTDGKTFILAMDHGSNFNVLPAMKDAKTLIRELAAAGADAFLSTIGMAENFAGSFLGKGIILRIDGGVSFLGDHRAPMQIVATAEDALRLRYHDELSRLRTRGGGFEQSGAGVSGLPQMGYARHGRSAPPRL